MLKHWADLAWRPSSSFLAPLVTSAPSESIWHADDGLSAHGAFDTTASWMLGISWRRAIFNRPKRLFALFLLG